MTSHDQKDKKLVTIIVNGSPHEWPKDEITYADVVTLDIGSYNPSITYTVNYERGEGNKPEGQLSPGSKPVKVKSEMIFSVTPTGQS